MHSRILIAEMLYKMRRKERSHFRELDLSSLLASNNKSAKESPRTSSSPTFIHLNDVERLTWSGQEDWVNESAASRSPSLPRDKPCLVWASRSFFSKEWTVPVLLKLVKLESFKYCNRPQVAASISSGRSDTGHRGCLKTHPTSWLASIRESSREFSTHFWIGNRILDRPRNYG